MSIINRITNWTSQILTSASLNGEFNNVINTLNNLDSATSAWTNVKTGNLNVTGTVAGVTLGRVRQWFFVTNSTNYSTTSSTFSATNLTGSITPGSASSNILIIASGTALTSNASRIAFTNIQRSPSTLLLGATGAETTAGASIAATNTLMYLDGPSTTSAVTYTVMLANDDNVATVKYGNGLMTTMLLVELL